MFLCEILYDLNVLPDEPREKADKPLEESESKPSESGDVGPESLAGPPKKVTRDDVETIPPPDSLDTVAPPTGMFPDEELSRTPDLTERYELRGFVGEGGMGLVYRAWDKELEEEIAIKVLQRQFMLNETDVMRFKREIKTARRIGHPNIIRIYDFGIADREAFISMELLPGGALSDREEDGMLPFDEALRVATEIASGLGAAHAEGVVHRDIKPHNVLFDANDRVKLVDFGIARFASAETVTQGVLGTPHYMSPEQADGREADERSDVYSLGILMFQLFTGELPFQHTSLTKMLIAQVKEEPPRPSDINPGLNPVVEEIILRCLEKKAVERYANGRELEEALLDVRRALDEGMAGPLPWYRRLGFSGNFVIGTILLVGLVGLTAWQGYDAVTTTRATATRTPIATITAPPDETPADALSPTPAPPTATPYLWTHGELVIEVAGSTSVRLVKDGAPVSDRTSPDQGKSWRYKALPGGEYEAIFTVTEGNGKTRQETRDVLVENGWERLVVFRPRNPSFNMTKDVFEQNRTKRLKEP